MSTQYLNAVWLKAAGTADVISGKPKIVELGGIRIALCKVENDPVIYAIEDICTHDDGPLAEGPQSGSEIECPRHGARFDVRTGAALSMPAITPVRTFKTRVNGNSIEVEVPK